MKKKDFLKSKNMKIRLTTKEYDILLKQQREYHQSSLSNLLRHFIFHRPLHVQTHNTELETIIRCFESIEKQYKGVCRNYNQVAKVVNIAYKTDKNILFEIQILKSYTKELITLTQYSKKIINILTDKNDSRNQ